MKNVNSKLGRQPKCSPTEKLNAVLEFEIFGADGHLKSKGDDVWYKACEKLSRQVKPSTLQLDFLQNRYNICDVYRSRKNIDGNQPNTSLLECDDFFITLSKDLWKTIKPQKIHRKSGEVDVVLDPEYPNLLAKAISKETKFSCCFNFERAIVRTNYIELAKPYIQVDGYCLGCGAVLVGLIEEDVTDDIENVIMHFNINNRQDKMHVLEDYFGTEDEEYLEDDITSITGATYDSRFSSGSKRKCRMKLEKVYETFLEGLKNDEKPEETENEIFYRMIAKKTGALPIEVQDNLQTKILQMVNLELKIFRNLNINIDY